MLLFCSCSHLDAFHKLELFRTPLDPIMASLSWWTIALTGSFGWRMYLPLDQGRIFADRIHVWLANSDSGGGLSIGSKISLLCTLPVEILSEKSELPALCLIHILLQAACNVILVEVFCIKTCFVDLAFYAIKITLC